MPHLLLRPALNSAAMNNGQAIAGTVFLGLLASGVREIVLLPQKQPGVRALLVPGSGPQPD
jgi:hypothetical protein